MRFFQIKNQAYQWIEKIFKTPLEPTENRLPEKSAQLHKTLHGAKSLHL